MKLLEINQFSTLSEVDCIQIQQELSKYVIEKNTIPLEDIQTVAGVDIAYWKKEEIEWAVCCIVVLDIHNKTIIENIFQVVLPFVNYRLLCKLLLN